MMSFFNIFTSIPCDNYFKIKSPLLTTNTTINVFTDRSIKIQNINNCEEFDINRSIKLKNIYEIIYEVLMFIKNNNICGRLLLYRYITVNDGIIVFHVSPLLKYSLSKNPTGKISLLLSKLVDYNLIDFTKLDNYEIKKNKVCGEYLLENLLLSVTTNIIYHHLNIYNKSITEMENIFQYCQHNGCENIMSHKNKCFVHKNLSDELTLIDDIKKDYPIDNQNICINCSANTNDSIFISKSYITFCNNCTDDKKNNVKCL